MAPRKEERSWARLCSRLDAEWRRVGASSAGRAAVRRWAGEEPALAGACSAVDVVARCQRSGDMRCRSEALAAVLRRGGTDEFAVQTVIQVMLPGLLRVVRESRYLVDCGSRWADDDELEQEVVTIAYERARALAGTTQVWPAKTLLDHTRGRVRVLAADERRWESRARYSDRSRDVGSDCDRSPAEELAQVVVDAVRNGTLAEGPAGVFYTCRVLGFQARELPAGACSTRSMYRSVRRTEQALVRACAATVAS